MTRFLLVFPRFRYPTGDPPLGPAILAAFLRRELPAVTIRLFDATFTPSFKALEREARVFSPDVTGIYCNTIMHGDVLHIANMVKKSGSFIIAGGPHATVAPGSLLGSTSIDAVVLGEGELPVLHLLRRYPDRDAMVDHPAILTRSTWKKKLGAWHPDCSMNLDTLPMPAYDMLNMKAYIDNWFQMDVVSPRLRGTNVLVSRGCPFACSFCQPTLDRMFGTRLRYRSPGRVIEEILYLKKHHGISAFILTDDTPTFNVAWMRAFVDLLRQEAVNLTWGCNTRVGLLDGALMGVMASVGFKRVMVGIESASQRVLDKVYNKGIKVRAVTRFCRVAKQHGLKIFAYFMIGAPTETRAEIKKTIDLAFTLPIDEATFSITTPLPGTHLEKQMRSAGFKRSRSFSEYDYYSSLVHDQGIPRRALRCYQRQAFLKFYLHPRRWPLVIRMLTSYPGIKKLSLKMKRFTKT